MGLVEQRTLGIQPGTSMQLPAGPLLVPSLVPLLSHLSSAVCKAPLLHKEIPYYRRKSLTIERTSLIIIGIAMGKSCNKGFLYVVRSLTIGGHPLLYSKQFDYTVCLEISRRGFPSIVRDFFL